LALLDLLSQRREVPLWALLTNSDSTSHAPIEINAIAVDAEDAAAKCAEGYTGLKLKVGAADIASDIARVRRVREAVGPDITLRIDANGAYDFDSAREMARAMTELNIALFEQPVGSIEQLIELRKQTPLPIGADEVVSSDPTFSKQMGACADFVVLKPMSLGGLIPSLRMAKAADDLGLGVIITSSWESIIGRTGALHLAAAVASIAKNQPVQVHSGLAHPFPKDLAPLWPIVGGAAALPTSAGLGVSPQSNEGVA
jgi:o-succinylbenzoate synthase